MPEPKKIGMVSSLEELRREGFVPFILSPLYAFLGLSVETNLIRHFAGELKKDVFSTEYDFDGLQLTRLPKPWTNRIWVMDDDTYPQFRSWLGTFEFIDFPKKLFAVPRCVTAPILDPFMRVVGAEAPRPEILHVWSPSTMRLFVKPVTHVEMLGHPIFKPGEAKELKEKARDEFLQRLPRPTSAPETIELVATDPEPTIIVRGRKRLGQT